MLLEVNKGCFYYKKEQPILQDISFSMNQGKIMAVMGRNGIGKTTLIKCIAGILPWRSGYSVVAGQKTSCNSPMKHIGYVPQAHKNSFSYPVRDMVVFGKVGHSSYFARPLKEDYYMADETLERIGIWDLRNKQCNELSGGQLQMVFIARALVNSPKLLILDEPEAHLDFRNQLRLLKLLKKISEEKGISCIINTHYPNHALRISDDCFLLGEGEYTVDMVEKAMTEKNIERYFSVKSKALYTEYAGSKVSSFIFLDEI